MLKITGSSNLALKELKADDNEVVRDGGKADNKNLFKKSKNAKFKI